MADLNELLKSKKVSTFVRQEKSRPWTIESDNNPPGQSSESLVGTRSKKDRKPKEALAIREHSVSNAYAEALAIREHSVSNASPDSVSKNYNKSDSVSNAYAEALAEPLAMREHSVSNSLAKSDFDALVGKERKLLIFVFRKCQSLGALETTPVTTEELRALLEISSERLRNVIYRLTRKQFFEVTAVKNGRSGWRKFCLQKELFQKLCLDHSVSNELAIREQYVSIASPKAYAEALAGSPSSSSISVSENLKTTTTSDQQISSDFSLPVEWSSVDCSRLSSIGFTQTHLQQLVGGKLSVEEVQDSIEFFAFDLNQNGKAQEIKGSPLNFFMGILRRGAPYAPPANYESPEAEARRKYLEGKRRLEKQRESQAHELAELEFAQWSRELSREEVDAIVPDVVRFVPKAEEASLKSYFQEHVWPALRTSIPGSFELERAEIRQQIEQSLRYAPKEETSWLDTK